MTGADGGRVGANAATGATSFGVAEGQFGVTDGRLGGTEVEAAADPQRDGDDEALVAVGLHGELGGQRLALAAGHVRHRQADGGDPAVEFGPADFQPGLVAGGVGVDGLLLLAADLQDWRGAGRRRCRPGRSGSR